MNFLSGLLGNATEVEISQFAKEIEPMLVAGEQADRAFKFMRDLFLFTNKRLIFIDKRGLTGKKIVSHTIPYASITRYAIETAGNLDMDSELQIWIRGSKDPLIYVFERRTDVVSLQHCLATHILR